MTAGPSRSTRSRSARTAASSPPRAATEGPARCGMWPSRPGCWPPPAPSRTNPSPASSGLTTLGPSRSSRSAPRCFSFRPGQPGGHWRGSRSGWWSGRRSPGRRAGSSRRSGPRPPRAPIRIVLVALPAASPPLPPRGGPGAQVRGARRGRRAPGRHDRRSVLCRPAERDRCSDGAFSAAAFPAFPALPAGDARHWVRCRGRSAGSVRVGGGLVPVGPAPSWPPSRPPALAGPGISARASRRPRRASSSSTSSRPAGRARPGRRHRAISQRTVADRADDRGQRQRCRDQPVYSCALSR